MKKYKLKCFTGGHSFKSKEDVFRDSDGYPICEDCLWEHLDHEWVSEYKEYIIETLKKKFNRNYNRWRKWFYENHVVCDGDHDDYGYYYEHKDCITVINGKIYCSGCIDKMNELI